MRPRRLSQTLVLGRPAAAIAIVCALAFVLACGKYGRPERVYNEAPPVDAAQSDATGAVESPEAGDEESDERKDRTKR